MSKLTELHKMVKSIKETLEKSAAPREVSKGDLIKELADRNMRESALLLKNWNEYDDNAVAVLGELAKGINPTSFNPLKNRGSKGKDKSMADLIGEGKVIDKDAVGHAKNVETKRKELVDDITQHDVSTGNHPKGVSEKEVREMHEYNHSSDEMSDKDIHTEHKRAFPKQY